MRPSSTGSVAVYRVWRAYEGDTPTYDVCSDRAYTSDTERLSGLERGVIRAGQDRCSVMGVGSLDRRILEVVDGLIRHD